MSVRPLDFDTETLGVKTGTINDVSLRLDQLRQVLSEAEGAGYKLLYWVLSSQDDGAGQILEEVYKSGDFAAGKVLVAADGWLNWSHPGHL